MQEWIKANWKWIMVAMVVVGVVMGLTDMFGG